MAKLIVSVSFVAAGLPAFAGNNHSIQYQARILDPQGKPFESSAGFQFTIRAPNGCILWSENQSINMANSNGALTVEIGAQPNTAPGALSFENIFSNSGATYTGLSGCNVGSSYTTSAAHDRTLTVTFNDGISINTLPPLSIKAVPYAHFAHFSDVAKSALGLLGVEIDSTATPQNGYVLQYSSGKWVPSSIPSGSVSNVGFAASSIFSVSGGPITSSGTINLSLASQNQNLVLAAPVSGAGTPSFRALAAADIPSLDASKITTGTFATALLGSNPISSLAGTLATSQLGSIPTSNLSGTLGIAQLGAIPTSLLSGTIATANIGMIPAANGGTGLDTSSAANGRLLIGNGSGFSLSTLGISNGLTQTLSSGGIALSTNAQTTNSNDTLIMRDGSGGFAAGTATLQGLTLQGLGTVAISTPATANYSMKLPASIGSPGQVMITDGTSALSWLSLPASGVGTVTNVGLTGNSMFNITGSSISTHGTFNIDWNTQAANSVLAAPNGSTGAPTFRALAAADIASGTFATARIPDLDAGKVVTGTLSAAVGGTGLVPAAGHANKVYALNAAGTGTEFKSILGGSGITVDSSVAGQLTINASGGGGGLPTGAIIAMPTATCPTGYVAADGSAVSRTTYADLFTLLGTMYGAGNGTTTFNLPDYRGQFLRGWANGSTNDPDRASRTDRGDGTTGDSVGTKQTGANEAHTHGVGTYAGTTDSQGAHTHSFTDNTAVAGSYGDFDTDGSAAVNAISQTSAGDTTASAGAHTHSVSLSGSSASSGGNETRPRNINVLYCIKQ